MYVLIMQCSTYMYHCCCVFVTLAIYPYPSFATFLSRHSAAAKRQEVVDQHVNFWVFLQLFRSMRQKQDPQPGTRSFDADPVR